MYREYGNSSGRCNLLHVDSVHHTVLVLQAPGLVAQPRHQQDDALFDKLLGGRKDGRTVTVPSSATITVTVTVAVFRQFKIDRDGVILVLVPFGTGTAVDAVKIKRFQHPNRKRIRLVPPKPWVGPGPDWRWLCSGVKSVKSVKGATLPLPFFAPCLFEVKAWWCIGKK